MSPARPSRAAQPSPLCVFLSAIATCAGWALSLRRLAIALALGSSIAFAYVAPADSLAAPPTAEWDQQSPANSPPARLEAPLAYDAATGEMVLFGGRFENAYLTDTWTFNGSTWTEQHPAESPPGSTGASMAYDAGTSEMVLLVGYDGSVYGDTWAYDGSTWTERHPAENPPGRYGASMAYDPATGETVLFGGYGERNRIENGYLADTWAYDGSTWTERHPAESPPARIEASMAYDSATGEIILFGGRDESGVLNDTWAYDGSTWTERHPAENPPGRYGASMAYDPATGETVLFGGGSESGSILGDPWTYNGSTWTEQDPARSPMARHHASMAYDPGIGEMLLFGGYGANGESLADTWTYHQIKAFPSISTSASAAVALGGKVHDEASLSGGSSPGGSITFRLYGPDDGSCANAPAYTSPPVAISGDGSYESAEFAPSAPGVYRWVASYSGDYSNEATAGACGETGETVTVSKASAVLSTSASAGVTVGGAVHDEALLSGGSLPGGSIVFKLYGPADAGCASSPVYSSPAVVVSGDGGYESGEFAPSAPGVYRWVASYSGDSDNEAGAGACGEAGESVTIGADPAPPGALLSQGLAAAPPPASSVASAVIPADVEIIGTGNTIAVHGKTAIVSITCRVGASCTGVVDLQSLAYDASGGLVYASTRYTIPAGKTMTVAITLGKAGRKLLRQHKHARAYLYLHPSGGLPVGTLYVGGEILLTAHHGHRP